LAFSGKWGSPIGALLIGGGTPGYDPAVTQWAELVAELLHRIQRDFEATLSDIDPGWLDRSPGPGANPIGWLAWHLTRSHDRNVSELSGHAQLWIAGG
jgi:DinB superfamily